MPSFASHIVVAKMVSKKLRLKDSLSYYRGTIYPDLIDEKNHYKKTEGNIRIAVPAHYLESQKMFSFFELGYYIHLLLDEIYLREYILGQNVHPENMFLDNSIYEDYTLLHQKLCQDFYISEDFLYKVLNMDREVVEEKNRKHYEYIRIKESKAMFHHLDYELYLNFLKDAADKIVQIILLNIVNENIVFTRKKYMTLKPRILLQLKQNKLFNSYYLWKNRLVKILDYKGYSVIEQMDIFKYPVERDLIEVTKNKHVNSETLKVVSLILEGTDGVGKSTVGAHLLKHGILCQDRSEDIICKYMLFDVEEKIRLLGIQQYLFLHSDLKMVFLVLDDKKELERRISSRKKISQYDLQTYQYNCLYEKTYQQLEYLPNLYRVDCKKKKVEEIVKEIMEIVI
ncbi:MAG: hypothetical protein HFH08_06640 [Bacilli bacterium]|nr:hypothetical protein [Bacilli bacterium]